MAIVLIASIIHKNGEPGLRMKLAVIATLNDLF